MRKRTQIFEEASIDEPLVNLTPLIDVVFVVLIAFMLIAPVLDIDRIDLAEAGSSEQKEMATMQSAPLSISVREDDTIWFHNKRVSLSELSNLLKKEKKLHPGQIPQVIHDSRARFGTYQSVKNTLEACGFEQMDIILRPHEKSPA